MTKLFKVDKYEKGSTEVVFLLILQVFYQLKIILKGNISKSEL